MQIYYDVVIIGAGPSGMACAASIAGYGLDVLVLDEQSAPGGQLYRQIEHQPHETINILGKDYAQGLSLVQEFRNSKVTYLPESTAWKISPECRVCFSRNGASYEVQGKRVVIATGAMERPVPFSGWTLPGVLTAGGADALFKTSGVLPTGPVCMIGSGPLMLLVAQHLIRAGIHVEHMLDTTPQHALMKALPQLPTALRRPFYLMKGAQMLYSTATAVKKKHTGITSYAIHGNGKVESILTVKNGKQVTIPAKTVLVHEGIISRIEFSRQLDLSHTWDCVQRYWHPTVDTFGRTSNPNIFMIGDGAYVHGGAAAALKGKLAAVELMQDIGTLTTQQIQDIAPPLKTALHRECSPRPFVDALYRPRPSLYNVSDETLICRCEEVTAGSIRDAIKTKETTPEMVKAITRCGMGPCQGRMCTIALNEIVAAETGQTIEMVTAPRVRPPVRNLSLGELAKMTLMPAQEKEERAE
ncbi:MAG: FAD-dependent oxidoreductase [Halodesulfovibrio sp.]|uniref:FAD-dependent oxidoreductase n=1 Tax=Halodesulfovibrio sp. TaxID=1912772 RepID=UPI00359DCBEE